MDTRHVIPCILQCFSMHSMEIKWSRNTFRNSMLFPWTSMLNRWRKFLLSLHISPPLKFNKKAWTLHVITLDTPFKTIGASTVTKYSKSYNWTSMVFRQRLVTPSKKPGYPFIHLFQYSKGIKTYRACRMDRYSFREL